MNILFPDNLVHVNLLNSTRLMFILSLSQLWVAHHRQTTIPPLFPDQWQIPGLFQVFQVAGHPDWFSFHIVPMVISSSSIFQLSTEKHPEIIQDFCRYHCHRQPFFRDCKIPALLAFRRSNINADSWCKTIVKSQLVQQDFLSEL